MIRLFNSWMNQPKTKHETSLTGTHARKKKKKGSLLKLHGNPLIACLTLYWYRSVNSLGHLRFLTCFVMAKRTMFSI